MIGYVTLGTNDLRKAAEFYDKIAAEMGLGRFMDSDTFIAWGSPGGGAGLGLTKPFDGKPMSAGNGVMVALAAKDRAQVDRIYHLDRGYDRIEAKLSGVGANIVRVKS